MNRDFTSTLERLGWKWTDHSSFYASIAEEVFGVTDQSTLLRIQKDIIYYIRQSNENNAYFNKIYQKYDLASYESNQYHIDRIIDQRYRTLILRQTGDYRVPEATRLHNFDIAAVSELYNVRIIVFEISWGTPLRKFKLYVRNSNIPLIILSKSHNVRPGQQYYGYGSNKYDGYGVIHANDDIINMVEPPQSLQDYVKEMQNIEQSMKDIHKIIVDYLMSLCCPNKWCPKDIKQLIVAMIPKYHTRPIGAVNDKNWFDQMVNNRNEILSNIEFWNPDMFLVSSSTQGALSGGLCEL